MGMGPLGDWGGMGPFGDEGAHCSPLANSVGGNREGDGAAPTPTREGDGGREEKGGGAMIFARDVQCRWQAYSWIHLLECRSVSVSLLK